MKNVTGIVVGALLLLLSLLPGTVQADTGDHWCTTGWNWTSRQRIPVWIHPDVAETLKHPDNTLWTDHELEKELQFVIERIMMQAPSGMPPMYFAGWEYAGTGWDDPAGNGPGGTPGPYNIALRPNWETIPEDKICTSHFNGSANGSGGARVLLGQSTWPSCNNRWTHWNYSNGLDTEPIGGILLHELFHTLGFFHQTDCNAPTQLPPCIDNPGEPEICGTMSSHGLSSEHYDLEYQDWEALTSVYGNWEDDGDFRRLSTNGTSWITMGGATVPSGPSWAGGYGRNSSFVPIVATDPGSLYPHLYRWNYSTGIFHDWGLSYTGSQFGNVGTALSSGHYYAFYMRSQSAVDVIKQPRYSDHTTSTSHTVVTTPLYASRQGVTGTHDPKTGQLIHIWRDWDNNTIMALSAIGAPPGTGGTPVGMVGNAYKSAFTPAVSCGDPSVQYNCILVWASSAAATGEHYHHLKWAQFYVSGGSFVFASTYNSGYDMFTPPSVVYRGPTTSSAAFVVSFQNPGPCSYTLTKSTSVTSMFSDLKSHCTSSDRHIGPPLSGSTENSTALTWTRYNIED